MAPSDGCTSAQALHTIHNMSSGAMDSCASSSNGRSILHLRIKRGAAWRSLIPRFRSKQVRPETTIGLTRTPSPKQHWQSHKIIYKPIVWKHHWKKQLQKLLYFEWSPQWHVGWGLSGSLPQEAPIYRGCLRIPLKERPGGAIVVLCAGGAPCRHASHGGIHARGYTGEPLPARGMSQPCSQYEKLCQCGSGGWCEAATTLHFCRWTHWGLGPGPFRMWSGCDTTTPCAPLGILYVTS